jgi:hypothetical protein
MTTMTTMTLTASTVLPVTHVHPGAKIAFSRPQTSVDRDFDMALRIKYVGTLAATAITLITGAVFLFM